MADFEFCGYTVAIEEGNDESLVLVSNANVQSFAKVAREVRKEQFGILNRIRSIVHDIQYLRNLLQNEPFDAVFANRSAGKWYVPHEISSFTCWFKSTDGHCGYWQWNLNRNNLHVALAAAHGRIVIVDSTRKGKKFPDSFNRTIPIWCAVLNSALGREFELLEMFPEWIPQSEIEQISKLVPKFVEQLMSNEALKTQVEKLHESLGERILCASWMSPSTGLIRSSAASEKVACCEIVCLSVSMLEGDMQKNHRKGWHYIQGAADDEQHWNSLNKQTKITCGKLWFLEKAIASNLFKTDDEIIEAFSQAEDLDHREEMSKSFNLYGIQFIFTQLESFKDVLSKEASDSVEVLCASSSDMDSFIKSSEEKSREDFVMFEFEGKKNDRLSDLFQEHCPRILSRLKTQETSLQIFYINGEGLEVAACLAVAISLHCRSVDEKLSKGKIRNRVQEVVSALSQDIFPSRSKLQQLNRYFLS